MTPPDPKALDRPWRIWASAAVGSALLLGILFGFLILPGLQRENAGLDMWTAFCRAIGVQAGSPAQRQPVTSARALPVSTVVWNPRVIEVLAHGRPQRGAQIAAAACVTCHGEKGVSATPDLPSLNGQTAAAIYKQLHDYRSGARAHPLMTPVAQQLKVPDLADVAVYFGADAQGGLGRRDQTGDADIVRLATEGDSARRIPACVSCHVNGAGGPIEAPVLTGQDRAYLARQLLAYKTGQRQNDVYRRMRAIAGQLSDEEIDGLSRYFEGVF
jgi:cytochrome c553